MPDYESDEVFDDLTPPEAPEESAEDVSSEDELRSAEVDFNDEGTPLDEIEVPEEEELMEGFSAEDDTEEGIRGLAVPGGLGYGTGSSINTMLAIMKKSGIRGVSVNSTYRPGANDYHGRSQAIDFGGSGSAVVRDKVAAFWYRFVPNLLELIHSSQNYYPYRGWYSRNGRKVGPYGPASAHWNHTHVAVRPSAATAILRALTVAAPRPPLQPPTVAPSLSLPVYPIPGVTPDARLVPAGSCPRICVGTGGKNSPPAESAWVAYLIKLLVNTYPSYWALAVQRGTKVENYKEADAAFLGAFAQFVAAHRNFVPAGYVWRGCVDKSVWSIFQIESPGSKV